MESTVNTVQVPHFLVSWNDSTVVIIVILVIVPLIVIILVRDTIVRIKIKI